MIKVINMNATNFSQIPTGWIKMTVEQFTRTYFLTLTQEGTYTTTLPGYKMADEFKITDTEVCDFEFYVPDDEPDYSEGVEEHDYENVTCARAGQRRGFWLL